MQNNDGLPPPAPFATKSGRDSADVPPAAPGNRQPFRCVRCKREFPATDRHHWLLTKAYGFWGANWIYCEPCWPRVCAAIDRVNHPRQRARAKDEASD